MCSMTDYGLKSNCYENIERNVGFVNLFHLIGILIDFSCAFLCTALIQRSIPSKCANIFEIMDDFTQRCNTKESINIKLKIMRNI